MSRIELKVLDRFFNGYLLKKRQIGKPFKYNVETPYEMGRFWDMVFFPKNKFQKLVSNTFERCMPTLQYVIWNPMTYSARKSGWTEQEKLYHNFFRGGMMMYHSYTQALHPMAYLERQRADMFFRRVETILPGIECPDWAHHNRRAVDFDFEGMMNPFRAMNVVHQENTPKPHYGNPYPSSICHIGNARYMMGYWAQRLFYNEEVRGNLQSGYYTDSHKKAINGWYADTQDNGSRDQGKTEEELREDKENAQRWINNIETYYPEYKNYKVPITPQKYNEPYYERTVEDIATSIFIQKWVNAMQKKVFNNSELQQVYEFYLHHRDEVFWVVNEEDGLYKPTELYTKYVKALDVPSVFELEKYTAIVAEVQYNNKLQLNYGITFNTVDTFRRQHVKFVQELGDSKNKDPITVKRIRALISEEVFNPMFRNRIADFAKGTNGSYVVAAYKSKGEAVLDKIEEIYGHTQEELHFINKESQNQFLQRIRNVVKHLPFKPQQIAEVRF